jgi:polyisoprenoid-binding protein YceI
MLIRCFRSRVRTVAFFTAAAFALCGHDHTQGQQPAAVSYQVDTNVSRVYARVDAASRLGHTHGVEGRLASGTFSLSGVGELVFDLTTFQADTAQARQYVGLDATVPSDARKVTANMLGLDVLDVGHYPRAVYSITSVRPLDGQAAGQPGRYQLDGRFTLHGNNQPLQFAVVVEPADKAGALRMRGTFTIRQTAFGIQPYSALAGLARVADPLPIWGDLVLYSAR